MEETTLKDLDPRLQKQVAAAEKAAGSGNPQYAIDICMDILKRNPACADVRKVLHDARRRKSGGAQTKGMTKFLTKVTSAPFSMKAKGQIEKDPEAVLLQAEQLLNANPANIAALRGLGGAASALELWRTAAIAYEGLRRQEPQNPEVLISLGNAYINSGEPEKAVNVCAKVLQTQPGNEAAQDIMRRASVAQTVNKGKWEEEGDFRDKVKDSSEAEALEQQSRMATDEASIKKMIAETEEKIQEEPENLGHYRQIANWYRKIGDYENALVWVGKARELPSGGSDTTLERMSLDLEIAHREQKLAALEAELEKNPDDAKVKEQVAQMQKETAEFRLKNVETLVEKYPNDYSYRYEYGVLLLEKGDYDKAIEQFQLAKRNPKVRLDALLNLGRAFKAKKINDLAVEQLQEAKSDVHQMNDQKKEIIYELASVFEQMGQMEDAIREYKAIYSADIGYRDVSQKINQFYEEKQS